MSAVTGLLDVVAATVLLFAASSAAFGLAVATFWLAMAVHGWLKRSWHPLFHVWLYRVGVVSLVIWAFARVVFR